DGGALEQRSIERTNLITNRGECAARVSSGIEYEHQQPRSSQMAEEADAEAVPKMSALDQSWDISDREALPVGRSEHSPAVWCKGGKRVIRYLGASRAQRRKQCGFSGIWQPDQSCLGY